MITFNNVTKEYKNHKKHHALRDVSFEIEDGEFVFLVGPSGSGKSTVVKMLVREETPSSGEIFFNDIEITNIKKRGLPILRREIGVVFQDYKLLPNQTVFENVAFILEVSGKPSSEVRKTTEYILDMVGLKDKIHNFPDQLSGGEKQRVAIARALVNDPQVLVADEPTGNLDPENAWDIIQILNKVNNWGTTVIMATHDKDVVDSLSKRVIEIKEGEIVRDEGTSKYQEEEKRDKKEDKEKEKNSKKQTQKKTEKTKSPESERKKAEKEKKKEPKKSKNKKTKKD